jgi:hypothetical protein
MSIAPARGVGDRVRRSGELEWRDVSDREVWQRAWESGPWSRRIGPRCGSIPGSPAVFRRLRLGALRTRYAGAAPRGSDVSPIDCGLSMWYLFHITMWRMLSA